MKTTKQYNEMTNDEKAQAIYSKLKDQSLTTLSELLMDLSNDYTSETIFTTDDWLDYEKDEDLAELIKMAQWSKELNINKKYVRESIFYSGYKSSDSVLDLVDEDESIYWIVNALNANDQRVKGLESMMKAN
jgi:hypothetical protein